MFHRNTNKFTLILMYAVLEWILILLLLLNSLFSYLIIKFAKYFGLNPPCLWCSRVDHIFAPAKKNKNLHRDLLCEVHAKEISKLGYCLNHQKLVDSQDMCEDCLSSRPEFHGVRLKCSCCGVILDNNIYSSYTVLKPSWDVLECANKEKLIDKSGENDNHVQEDYKSYEKISDFVTALCDDEHWLENENGAQILSDFDKDLNVTEKEIEDNGSIFVSMSELKESEGEEDEKVDVILEMEEEKETITMKDKSVQVSIEEEKDVPLDISPQHLEFFLDNSGHRLVPVELIDSITDKQKIKNHVNGEDNDKDKHQVTNSDSEVWLKTEVKMVVEDRFRREEAGMVLDFDFMTHEDPKYMMFDSMEIEEDENSLVFHAKECHLEMGDYEQDTSFHVAQSPSQLVGDVQEMKAAEGEKNYSPVAVSEEVARISNCETEGDVSIGTEIPDLYMTDEIQNQDYVLSYESTHEDPLTTFSSFTADYHGPLQVQEQKVELKALAVQNSEHKMNEKPLFHLQLNDIVEDKVPDTPASTPTSVDSLYHLHKKFPLLEKKDSATEESLDGSVTSELECGDGVVTIEHLKSALRSERKTLHALYAELEEERSASAVAANQTMAMINRLQEEKAAVQMEALQYQRMMEEQSEYDQEALQLLNELMVKREKEKQELEKELEIYRKKVLEYETKEKMRTLRKSKDGSTRSGFSSASYSNGEDSDGLSIDLNQEAKVEESFYSHLESSNQNTPVDAALNLDESLADFEEERLSILEQLKLLEEKLMTLDIQEEQNFVDFRPIEDFHEENGNHMDENAEENGNHVDENAYFGGEANGHANGFTKEINGKHHQQRRIVGSNGKRLLPLFDAISDENGNVVLNENGNGFESNGVHNSYESKLELDNKKFVIEEEVDHLYERLQALEADREFLKHCISSLRKGDKGMDLLQEILQHLRDLRNVEFRVRNLSDTAIV
ncbi:Myosin-binding protein 2 [Abeliophyllum distichum]|uniref:Myosin-binding protein 2 n=1 Tax=Abeliophyllum distichum TaxID=126358 RepID=A0ABD1VYN7_9LAMI